MALIRGGRVSQTLRIRLGRETSLLAAIITSALGRRNTSVSTLAGPPFSPAQCTDYMRYTACRPDSSLQNSTLFYGTSIQLCLAERIDDGA